MKNMMRCNRVVAGWLVLCGLSVALAAPAAAVGSAVPVGARGASARPGLVFPALCAQISTVDRLVVKRIKTIPQNQIHFSFPVTVTVQSPVAAQKAARIVCALPPMPNGVISCPDDLGITYRLTFYQQAVPYPRVVVDATGCETVSGLVRTRWVIRSPKFWPELGEIMGLKGATWATFRGSGAPG